ncbi:ribonuclease H-like domain-containing protein [Mycena alexandri]|uniref:Ribonuclease H-like domain-containing protein n=1 Tax=Mycena alexandri TaxID=1745969 RepID=A0AAD6WUA4_9AGAR|nr:ribonuclease H-like domain-containing protein [Mycena alexandri]
MQQSSSPAPISVAISFGSPVIAGPQTPIATDATTQSSDEIPAEHHSGVALRTISREPSAEPDTEEEDEGPSLTDGDIESLRLSTITMGLLNVATVIYLTTEVQANEELASITEGVVGFDTEFVKRVLYGDEEIIDGLPIMGASAKKTARLAIQVLESRLATFSIRWDNTGICLVQIARGDKIWVLNMNRIRAFPTELRRIIESPNISLAGAGIISDGAVIWEDLRCNARSLVDVGLMARLAAVENHQEEPFSNLGLEVAMLEVMDIVIDKTFQKNVNWKAEPNKAHLLYAAIDTAASLRLYEDLAPEMKEEEEDLETTFSPEWYTFNLLPPVPARLFVEADVETARDGVPFTGPVPPVKTGAVTIPISNATEDFLAHGMQCNPGNRQKPLLTGVQKKRTKLH